MKTGNMKNERLKRQFINWLKGAEGLSESTLRGIENSIWLYENLIKFEDIWRLSPQTAGRFCDWLRREANEGKGMSLQNQHHTLRNLRRFFQWLSIQPGFKSKFRLSDIAYFRLDRKQLNQVRANLPKDCPSLEYVLKLTESITPNSDIDLRDRALIAFLLLSGMRDQAVVTLPLGCFDPQKLEVRQFPSEGVNTKFGKVLINYLFRFDSTLLNYILEWTKHLKEDLLFASADPLFPKTEVVFNPITRLFESRGLAKCFWKGTGALRQILKERTQAAGLKYMYPHSFRHAANHLAMKRIRTAEEMRAVSQNLGHENIGTTLTTYGKLDHLRVAEIISGLELGETDKSSLDPESRNLLAQLERKLKGSA